MSNQNDKKEGKGKLLSIILIVLVAILIGLCILLLRKQPNNKEIANAVIASTEEADSDYNGDKQDKPKNDKFTTIAGYTTVFVDEENPYIKLVNSEKNDVYFKYIIRDTKSNELIFESDLIEPGKQYKWAAKDSLTKEGTYETTWLIQTFNIETLQELTSATQTVTVKIY
ncbi:MAG: hypothetical protein J6A59_08150 [Lachnospiraceae bacterium]|nr:hypothetical protein [Lachnospiraceae bacterium]